MGNNMPVSDYPDWLKRDKETQQLKDLIWSWVKGGYICPNCQEKIRGRVMFRQWKKYHRFLCPDCETLEQIKGGEWKKVKPHNE